MPDPGPRRLARGRAGDSTASPPPGSRCRRARGRRSCRPGLGVPVAQLRAPSSRPAPRVVRCNYRLLQAPLGIAVDRLQRDRDQIREPTAKQEIGEAFGGRILAAPLAGRCPHRRQRQPQLVHQNGHCLARRRKAVPACPGRRSSSPARRGRGHLTASADLLQDRLAIPLDRVGVKPVQANLHGPIVRLGRS